jgi:hypothetical protein
VPGGEWLAKRITPMGHVLMETETRTEAIDVPERPDLCVHYPSSKMY